MSDEWGFADIYAMDDEPKATTDLVDVQTDDWRNILVLGRATADGVYPETLALVGRARYLADELGCRVEVLLIGEELDAARAVLKNYPIDNVYCVKGPAYAPIDYTAKVLEAVVRKRRPELIMVFQSRTGDAITAYTAERLGGGFVIGATSVEIDTYERRVRATHIATNEKFQTITEFQSCPQFVSVQRGMFRAPLEDSFANVSVHDMDIDPGPTAAIEVMQSNPPAPATLANASVVVVAGARCKNQAEVDAARELAKKLGGVFGVTRSVHDRGLGSDDERIGWKDQHLQASLVVAVGVRGSLETIEAFKGSPTICAVGCKHGDPILRVATYAIKGEVGEAIQSVTDEL